MSEGVFKRCDNEKCDIEETFQSDGFGCELKNWITVSRASSNSNNKIKAGKYHFCSEKCLKEFLAD